MAKAKCQKETPANEREEAKAEAKAKAMVQPKAKGNKLFGLSKGKKK